MATARIAAAIKKLPADQRTIELSDAFFDGAQDDATMGTWFDYMSPNVLMAGDGGPEVVAQWLATVPGAICKATRTRGGSTLEEAVDQMEASVGRDISGLSKSAQAAAVAGWWKRTRSIAHALWQYHSHTRRVGFREQGTHTPLSHRSVFCGYSPFSPFKALTLRRTCVYL